MAARRVAIALVVGILALAVALAQAQTRMVYDHPGRFAANVADIGATLTELVAAPTGGQAVYVTTIVLASSTATAGAFALRAGTGTNCGTNPVGVFPQPGVSSPTLTYVYPANTAVPFYVLLQPAVRLPAGYALCLIGAATNLARGQVHGFVAP
jgi:hypothetical protein